METSIEFVIDLAWKSGHFATAASASKEWKAAEARAEAAEARTAQLEIDVDEWHAEFVRESKRAAQAEAQLTAAVLPVAELVSRANEAAQLQAEVAAHRARRTQIRELVNAYPEHDTVEAVRRAVELLHSVEAERDEQKQRADILDGACAKALNERDGWVKVVKSALDAAGISYGLTFDDAVKTLVHQRDAARRELQQAQEALHPFAHLDLTKKLSGNEQGDESIIYQRNDAVLTLGDFRRAYRLINPVVTP